MIENVMSNKSSKSDGERVQTVCYRLPSELKWLVSVEAATRRMGKSELVEMAIRRFLKSARRAA
jgi:hypothetical protein